MSNFWADLPKPFFVLAPMEAVTDVVFRHVVAAAARPDVFFTEFVNASSYCSPKGIASTKGRLTFTADEQPMVVQIWGNKPDQYAQMSLGMAELGFAGIDINMGCPDKSVVHGGSGSGLIRTPELAGQLIAAAKTGGLPVSVKTRIGDRKVEEWRDWLTFLLQQDIVNLTVHLRTRKEMTKVEAHFELIPEIMKLRDEIAPQTLITINGDIRDHQHGLELAAKYGVDGIMIGRGVFQDPFAFEINKREHTNQELVDLLNYHLDMHDKYATDPSLQGLSLQKVDVRKFDPLKRFLKIYVRNFPGASEVRDKMMHTTSTDEVRAILASVATS